MNVEGERRKQAFDRLKAELGRAFAAPESAYEALTAAEVIARNRASQDLTRK